MTNETKELELVSTAMLEAIIQADGPERRKIEAAADDDTRKHAVLAHNTVSGNYEFVDVEGNDDFSLVSTQMLYKMLQKDNPVATKSSEPAVEERPKTRVKVGGFDPYNSG